MDALRQPEALRLADMLDDEAGVDGYVLDEAAAELRRLHALDQYHAALNGKLRVEIARLRVALEQVPPPEAQTEAEQRAYCAGWWAALEAKRKEQP